MNSNPKHIISRRAALQTSGAAAISASLHRAPATSARTTSGRRSDEPTGTENFLKLMGYVDKRMGEIRVPSVGVAVVDGDTRHTCALGVTSIADPVPADAQTMFRLGPLSRLFTGSAIGSLIESGAVSLDDPVRSYIPTLAVRDSNAPESLTVGDLVTHRTGWQGDPDFDPGNGFDALARYVDALKTLPFLAQPGELFSYEQADGVLAGYLLEQITGLPFEAAIRDLILSPLSMDQSSFLPQEIRGLPTVQGHTRQGDAVVTVDPLQSTRVAAPVTGLFSNLNEVLQFVSYHAAASTPPTFISAPVRELMHRPLGSGGSVGPIRIDAMGVSWMISEVGGTSISMHAGTDHGQSAMMAVVPSRTFGVVVVTNADFAQDLAIEITYRALDLFCGLRPYPVSTLSRPDRELEKLTGTYSVPGGHTFRVSHSERGLHLDSSHPESARAMSGPLAFVSPLTAMLTDSGSTTFVDFVLDSTHRVAWLRHMGQLAPRSSV